MPAPFKAQHHLPTYYNTLDWKEKKEVREQYMFDQDYKCSYCQKDLGVRPKQTRRIDLSKFPPNFLKYPVHLHHSHKTGLTIGAVHSYCNAVLWQYEGE